MVSQIQENLSIDRGPRIMIHTCNSRQWYVYDFLIPSLVEQGIEEQDIKVWHDYTRIGNLQSFVASMKWIKENCDPALAIWHIQDDVVISKYFKQEIEKEYQGIACGFCCYDWNGGTISKIGRVPAKDMWFSFQCIRIPNKLAGQFYDWFYKNAVVDNRLWGLYKEGKHDDEFWRTFIYNNHIREHVMNLKPSIVDHIDWMIGNSTINDRGTNNIRRAFYWQDHGEVRELERKLHEAGRYVR